MNSTTWPRAIVRVTAWLALFLACQPAYAQTPVIKLCYEDTSYVPWLVKGGQGLDNKLLEMASAKSGVKIEMGALPWKRCLGDVANGDLTGVIAASFNEERAAFAVYPTTADGKLDTSRRIRFDSYSLYRLKGSTANWDGKQFSNLTGPVGAQLGYSVIADIKKLGVAVEEGGATPESQMSKLVEQRIQLAALLTPQGDVLLDHAKFSGKIEKIFTPLIEKPYFLIFGKDYYSNNKKTVEALWAGLAAARESREFKALMKKEMEQ